MALTAVYLIGSAIRAQRKLPPITSTNKEDAMQQQLRCVLLSGCLTITITVPLGAGTNFMFHPTGFAITCGVSSLIVMVSSLLQIEVFKPATGAPTGPLQELNQELEHLIRHRRCRTESCSGA